MFPSPDWGELIESVSLPDSDILVLQEGFPSPDWGELIERVLLPGSIYLLHNVSIPRLGGVDRKKLMTLGISIIPYGFHPQIGGS